MHKFFTTILLCGHHVKSTKKVNCQALECGERLFLKFCLTGAVQRWTSSQPTKAAVSGVCEELAGLHLEYKSLIELDFSRQGCFFLEII